MSDYTNYTDQFDVEGGGSGLDASNIFDQFDLGGGSAGNFDLSSLLADLNIGTDLGATSNMDMNQELLNSLGLGDLASESKISNAKKFIIK
jgi:hypothetical protein